MMKIIINAVSTKKRAGGVFQISTNFIIESKEDKDVEWYYFVSEDLDNVLSEQFSDLKETRYFPFPTQPDFKHSYFRVRKQLADLENQIKPDLVYSIAAPSYFSFKCREVMRFTMPWVTHPNKYAWSVLSTQERIHMKSKVSIIKHLLKRSKYFITQTQTCKDGIIKITKVEDNHVKVVSNVLPAAYRDAERTHIKSQDNWIDVACIGNPFKHKNFEIIPDVLHELSLLKINNVRFHTTIPVESEAYKYIENRLKEFGLENGFVTYGRCTQKELIDIYHRCCFCFQPTLLEVFSASTIEAMYFQLPTVASDMPFNREVFEDSCLYYEPRNAKQAAEKFSKLIKNVDLQKELVQQMENRLEVYGNYGNHFLETKEFLMQVAHDTF